MSTAVARHDQIVAIHNPASIHHRRDQFEQAEALYRRAPAVKENVLGRHPPELATTLSAETLARLEAMGADIKEALAYAIGWVGADSTGLGGIYNELVELLRAEVTIHARLAWASPPASTASKMNIGGPQQPDEVAVRAVGIVPAEWLIVQLFSTLIQYRIGWRRYVWIRPLLRQRIAQLRIVTQAEEAFAVRSARLLNLAPDPA